MIRRVGDCSNLPNDSLEIIAKVIKEKDDKKLYRTCNSNEELSIAIKEIKLKGYNSKIEKFGDKYNVYSILPETVNLNEAEKSGQFKKLAWGRYSFQKANSINGFQPLNYDDGSIWKVITNEDGKQYLVKEVDDDDEDKIVRNTTATLKKKADSENYVDDQNFSTVMQILYHNSSTPNSNFMDELLEVPSVRQTIYNLLAKKLDTLIVEKLQQQNISDPKMLQDILQHIQKSIDDNEVVDENTLESIIYNWMQEVMHDSSHSIGHI